MKKVKNSTHDSALYEIELIPPKFNLISKKVKELHDFYEAKYNEAKYLFDED